MVFNVRGAFALRIIDHFIDRFDDRLRGIFGWRFGLRLCLLFHFDRRWFLRRRFGGHYPFLLQRVLDDRRLFLGRLLGKYPLNGAFADLNFVCDLLLRLPCPCSSMTRRSRSALSAFRCAFVQL